MVAGAPVAETLPLSLKCILRALLSKAGICCFCSGPLAAVLVLAAPFAKNQKVFSSTITKTSPAHLHHFFPPRFLLRIRHKNKNDHSLSTVINRLILAGLGFHCLCFCVLATADSPEQTALGRMLLNPFSWKVTANQVSNKSKQRRSDKQMLISDSST